MAILRIILFVSFLAALVFSNGCGSARTASTPDNPDNVSGSAGEPVTATEEGAEGLAPELLERLRNEKWTGDLGGLVERRYVRALVLYNKTNFFYEGPQARGVSYEGLMEFEKFLNNKLNTGQKKIYMVFIPVTREEGLQR